MKKDKQIGLTPQTKKTLTKMAADVGLLLKPYCERVLERHAKEYEPTKKKDNREYPKTPKESFITPVAIEVDFSVDKPAKVTNLETKEETILEKPEKEVPKMVVQTGDKPKSDIISIDDKKGAYARAEANIYTNGKIWQYRIFKDGDVLELYFKTKEEAIAEREKNKPKK